jgi:hypothetical protein
VETTLEICRTASKAVHENPALLALPFVATSLSLGVLAYLGLVTAYILTPDPETIAAQIDTLSEAFARRWMDTLTTGRTAPNFGQFQRMQQMFNAPAAPGSTSQFLSTRA